MARDFSAELAEFITAVSGPLNPGETWPLRLEHGWQEFTDVAGTLIDDLDEEERAVELPGLKLQAQTAVLDAIARVPNLPTFARMALNAAVPTLVPMALDALAANSTIAVEARDRWLVPAIDTGIRLLLRTRRGLAPDAPPIRLEDVNQLEGGGAQSSGGRQSQQTPAQTVAPTPDRP